MARRCCACASAQASLQPSECGSDAAPSGIRRCSNQGVLTHRVAPLTGVCKSAEQVVVCKTIFEPRRCRIVLPDFCVGRRHWRRCFRCGTVRVRPSAGCVPPHVRNAYPRSFVELVRDYSLAIAQPAIEHGPVSWPITRRIPGSLVHRHACVLSVFGWSVPQPNACFRRCTGNHDLDASPCVEVMVRLRIRP